MIFMRPPQMCDFWGMRLLAAKEFTCLHAAHAEDINTNGMSHSTSTILVAALSCGILTGIIPFQGCLKSEFAIKPLFSKFDTL